MSDQNMLSQEEIDALLQGDFGLDNMQEEASAEPSGESVNHGIFTPEQIRVLLEISDRVIKNEIGVLGTYISQNVSLSASRITVIRPSEIQSDLLSTDHMFVSLDFDAGKSAIVIPGMTAAMIATLMTGEEWESDPDYEFDELKLSALQDGFNGLVGKMVPALKAAVGKDFINSPPTAIVLSGKEFPPNASLLRETELVQVSYDLNIGEEAPVRFWFFLSMNFAENLLKAKIPGTLFASDSVAGTNHAEVSTAALAPQAQSPVQSPATYSQPAAAIPPVTPQMPGMDPQIMQMLQQQQAMMQQMAAQQQMAPQPQMGNPMMGNPMMGNPMMGATGAAMNGGGGGQQPPVQMGYSPWQFAPVAPFNMGGGGLGNIELLRDVSLQITVELGRTRMPIGQILELVNGSIVELKKQAGEAVELYVQGKLIARGEVVIIDENFGIRITNIISPQERLGYMQGR